VLARVRVVVPTDAQPAARPRIEEVPPVGFGSRYLDAALRAGAVAMRVRPEAAEVTAATGDTPEEPKTFVVEPIAEAPASAERTELVASVSAV
jgi:hypothetical protein